MGRIARLARLAATLKDCAASASQLDAAAAAYVVDTFTIR